MKKFKFSLQPSLNVKNTLEKQQKGEFAKAQQYYNECLNQLELLKRTLAEADAQYQDIARTGTSATNLVMFSQYFTYMNEEINNQKLEVQRALEARAQKQKQLIKTMQERKVLEKLKERKLEEYNEEVRAEQEKEIGDLVSYRSSVS